MNFRKIIQQSTVIICAFWFSLSASVADEDADKAWAADINLGMLQVAQLHAADAEKSLF